MRQSEGIARHPSSRLSHCPHCLIVFLPSPSHELAQIPSNSSPKTAASSPAASPRSTARPIPSSRLCARRARACGTSTATSTSTITPASRRTFSAMATRTYRRRVDDAARATSPTTAAARRREEGELARLFLQAVPHAEKVQFFNTGSEATSHAHPRGARVDRARRTSSRCKAATTGITTRSPTNLMSTREQLGGVAMSRRRISVRPFHRGHPAGGAARSRTRCRSTISTPSSASRRNIRSPR